MDCHRPCRLIPDSFIQIDMNKFLLVIETFMNYFSHLSKLQVYKEQQLSKSLHRRLHRQGFKRFSTRIKAKLDSFFVDSQRKSKKLNAKHIIL